MHSIKNNFKEFENINNPPKEIFYIGNKSLLNKRKISIVGTRKPNPYTKTMINRISKKLSLKDVVVVSGGALGVDAIAHNGAKENTIAVVANGLDIRYPKFNYQLIKYIEENALIMSGYKIGVQPLRHHFLERNQMVVALGEVLIIGQADLRSGSMSSANIAKSLNKQIYVLPHRSGESKGTNSLLEKNEAKAIYDIDDFLNEIGINEEKEKEDKIINFIQNNNNLQEAINVFGDAIYEYEMDNKIKIIGGYIYEV
jgi:DNA processing protein